MNLTLSPPSLLTEQKTQEPTAQEVTRAPSFPGLTLGVALPWLWLLLATGALLECIIAHRNAGEANLGLGEVGLKVILKSGWEKKKLVSSHSFLGFPSSPPACARSSVSEVEMDLLPHIPSPL